MHNLQNICSLTEATAVQLTQRHLVSDGCVLSLCISILQAHFTAVFTLMHTSLKYVTNEHYNALEFILELCTYNRIN